MYYTNFQDFGISPHICLCTGISIAIFVEFAIVEHMMRVRRIKDGIRERIGALQNELIPSCPLEGINVDI